MDIVDRLFVTVFDRLNRDCEKELEAVGRQYPFEPLKVMKLYIFYYKYFVFIYTMYQVQQPAWM